MNTIPPFDPDGNPAVDKDRPYQERLIGSRPTVPLIFVVGMEDVGGPAVAGTVNDDGTINERLSLPTEEQDQPYRFTHTLPGLVCAFCGGLLTIVDRGDVCRQCRLEGRNA